MKTPLASGGRSAWKLILSGMALVFAVWFGVGFVFYKYPASQDYVVAARKYFPFLSSMAASKEPPQIMYYESESRKDHALANAGYYNIYRIYRARVFP